MAEAKTTIYDTVVVYPIIFLPVLIMFYIISSTFLNQNSSTLVYGIGFVITLVFTGIVNRLSLSEASKATKQGRENPSEYCFYGVPSIAKSMIGYLKASPNAAIIMYTFMYFISSTIVENFSLVINPLLMLNKLFKDDLDIMIFFACLLYLAKKVEKQLQCNNEAMNGLDYVNGMVVGFFAFWSYITLFFVMGKESFFIQSHFLSNKKYCDSPSYVTYKCDNESVPKKYIVISDNDYIDNANKVMQPHKDMYYSSRDVIKVTGKNVYLSPGTKVNVKIIYKEENTDDVDVDVDIDYSEIRSYISDKDAESISATRAYNTYSGDTNNVKHYVGLKKLISNSFNLTCHIQIID